MIEHFPSEYTATQSQKNLIDKIDQGFKKNKYLIVSAPTGSGKSFLSATLGNASKEPSEKFKNLINSYEAFYQDFNGRYIKEDECLDEPAFGSFILTITKALQNQYSSLFPEAKVFKGKGNYVCDVDEVSDVEVAPCLMTPKLKDDCWKKNRCPYYVARNHALSNKFSILNYKLFFTLPDHIKRKNFIVCDEASELENELVKNYTFSLNFNIAEKYGIPIKRLREDDFYKSIDWVEDSREVLKNLVEDIVNSFANKRRSISEKEKQRYLYVKNLYSSLNNIINFKDHAYWIVDNQKDIVNFVPLKVDQLAKNIFNFSDKVLLMSATIVDHKKYANTLGIDDYEYIEADSNFEISKSPIYISTKHKLNYGNIDEKIPLLANDILKICEEHSNSKGIIHTHTLAITEKLKKHLKGGRFLFRDNNSTNDEILLEHFESPEPTILVSPSLTFGIDLKDELGRFCIVFKLPYPPLFNKRIKRLFDQDKVWYINSMLNGLVQMCGRCTRSEKDFSDTYILDGNIKHILFKNKGRLPKYFVERFK
jgi:ATP-dependent DNA helicase DinG